MLQLIGFVFGVGWTTIFFLYTYLQLDSLLVHVNFSLSLHFPPNFFLNENYGNLFNKFHSYIWVIIFIHFSFNLKMNFYCWGNVNRNSFDKRLFQGRILCMCVNIFHWILLLGEFAWKILCGGQMDANGSVENWPLQSQ